MLSDELSLALVLTINQATFSACFSKSIVTEGDFSGFALRFANDFQPSLDDWAEEMVVTTTDEEIATSYDMVNYCYGKTMNALTVPEGSYKVGV